MENEVVTGKYSKICSFSEGLAAVRSKKTLKWGFIDETGNEVISCKYDEVHSFSDDMAVVGTFDSDKYEKDLKLYPFLDQYQSYSEKREMFTKWGCIDKSGKEIVPCKYLFFKDFSEGFARVAFGDLKSPGLRHVTMGAMEVEYERDYKYGVVDKNGNEIIPCIYENVNDITLLLKERICK